MVRMMNAKWKPRGKTNEHFDHFDIVGIMPNLDEVYLHFDNEKRNRSFEITFTTDEAEEYAKYLFRAVKKQRKIQKVRKHMLKNGRYLKYESEDE